MKRAMYNFSLLFLSLILLAANMSACNRFGEGKNISESSKFPSILNKPESAKSAEDLIQVFAVRNDAVQVDSTKKELIKRGEESVEALVSALKDRSATVRLYACELLVQIQGERAAGHIAVLLADPDPLVRDSTVDVLNKMPESALIHMVRIFPEYADNASFVESFDLLLGEMGYPVIESIISLCDTDPSMKHSVMACLAGSASFSYKLSDYYRKGNNVELIKSVINIKCAAYASSNNERCKKAIMNGVFANYNEDIPIMSGLFLEIYSETNDPVIKSGIILITKDYDLFQSMFSKYNHPASVKEQELLLSILNELGDHAFITIYGKIKHYSNLRDAYIELVKNMDSQYVYETLLNQIEDKENIDAASILGSIADDNHRDDLIQCAKRNIGNYKVLERICTILMKFPADERLLNLGLEIYDTRDSYNEMALALQTFSYVADEISIPDKYKKPNLNKRGKGDGKQNVAVVIYLDDNNKAELAPMSFSTIPSVKRLSSMDFTTVDTAIYLKDKYIYHTTYYTKDNKTKVKGYRVDTVVALVDISNMNVMAKVTVKGEELPYQIYANDISDDGNFYGESPYIDETILELLEKHPY